MSNTAIVAAQLKEHAEESAESRRDLAKGLDAQGREQTRLGERLAAISRSIDEAARDADERRREDRRAFDQHCADDRQATEAMRDGLASLSKDVTAIRSRMTWASGAIWAVAAVIAAIGVGALTIGKFAAERWVREISDKAVEAAVKQQRWGAP